MCEHLHKLSATLFYSLGLTFFIAYFLVRTDIHAMYASWWLRIADLPLALVACFYGGFSLYRSIANPERPSPVFAITIAIPLLALFVFLIVLNFWEKLGLPTLSY